jgi:hypothetical protein
MALPLFQFEDARSIEPLVAASWIVAEGAAETEPPPRGAFIPIERSVTARPWSGCERATTPGEC